MSDSNPKHSEPPSSGNDETARLEAGDDHQLVLIKGEQRYVFRCPPGDESTLLNQLAVLVGEDDNNLTWFDAAVLSHQLGQRMSRALTDQKQRRSA